MTALLYLKPQEFVPALQEVPTLYIMFALCIVALGIEMALGRIPRALPPGAGWVAAFVAWCFFTAVLRDRTKLSIVNTSLGVGILIYLMVAWTASAAHKFRRFGLLLLGLAMFLALVCIHQSVQPRACFFLDPRTAEVDARPELDGRPCETGRECQKETGRDDVDWICERPGLFGTYSIGGRVRYRGTLEDPNELCLVIGAALPFAFLLVEKGEKKRPFRSLFVGLVLLVAGWCVIETASRGGQIVYTVVLGAYLIRTLRLWGVVLGAAASLPVLLLGGRSGQEADESSQERIDAWAAGLQMFREHPITGVGTKLFADNYSITAHNSYILVLAENGIVGLFLWSVCLYITLKIAWALWWAPDARLDPSLSRSAAAFVVSMVGLMAGVFFLSFAYHNMMFLFIGLGGALALAAQTTVPDFRPRVAARELLAIAGLDLLFLAVMLVYTKLKAS